MADDRSGDLQVILIVLLISCVISTSLRFYTMGVLLKRFYIEDWFSLATLVLYIAYTGVGFMNVKYGIGKHLVDVPPSYRPIAMMWRWIGTYFYIVIAALVKITIALFLLRICNHRRWERITLWSMIGIVAAYNLFFVLLAIFACRPIEYQWTGYNYPVPAEGECNSSGWATYPSYIAGFLNVVADWMLPLLPARLVWQAKMERRKKLSVCAVLALGSIASIASIVRLPYAINVLDNPEYLYNSEPMCAWSTVEIGLGLTASSLATLTPLFRKIKVFKRSHLSGEDQTPSAGTPANLPSFVHKGRPPPVPAKDDGHDVEALKHHRQPSAEARHQWRDALKRQSGGDKLRHQSRDERRHQSSDELRQQSTDELRHQPSDEFYYKRQPSESLKRQPSEEIELYRFP